MFVLIDRNSPKSIKKQLYDSITKKILNGELKAGVKIPSSRHLSIHLNIARNTVREIYDQLVAESYLETVQGKGTYVACLEKHLIKEKKEKSEMYTLNAATDNLISFIAGTPDLSEFPRMKWMSCLKKSVADIESVILDYNGFDGYKPLRKTLSEYLLRHKGINCSYENIIITNGTRAALSLIALYYKKKVENIIIESPAVNFALDIFNIHGYLIKPVKVDEQGILTNQLPRSKNCLIYVTPSHQFPFGGTLSINRRLTLIKYAQENGHLILEDDYDSEFRYKGAPVNSLYQLSPEKVIHIGTFSKTLAPSLRLGYMAVPPAIYIEIKKFYESIFETPNMIVQMVMNEIITSGEYEKHIYKMRRIYKKKLNTLIRILTEEFNDQIKINGENSGLHISVEFNNIFFNKDDKEIFTKYGLIVDYDSDYMLQCSVKSNIIILGFGHLTEEKIIAGVKKLKKAVEEIIKKQS